MKVLIGCEFSGIVRDAFAAGGHDAWSCDIVPSERPGNHIQGSILSQDIVNQHWDLMIAHPDCTFARTRTVLSGWSRDVNRQDQTGRSFFLRQESDGESAK